MMDSVPPHAAVHESVEAVVELAGRRYAGLVNAVLRRVAGDRDLLLAALAQQSLGIRESHPDLLVRRWKQHYGAERTDALCRWNNERPRVVIHVDTRRIGFSEYQAALEAVGVAAEPHPARPAECLALAPGTAVTHLPGYADGQFTVQDPATITAVDAMDPQPGERVLDACAAPGGKLLLMAARMHNQGDLVAMDTHRDRLIPLRANVERMGVTANIVRGDAREPAAARLGPDPFQGILLDVPCSNTGVLSRRPDARWRFAPGRLDKLVATQRAMLDNLAPLVARGGRLVYSTCSLEPEENERQIAAFIQDHPGFRLESQTLLFPPESQTDGAYVAQLRRD